MGKIKVCALNCWAISPSLLSRSLNTSYHHIGHEVLAPKKFWRHKLKLYYSPIRTLLQSFLKFCFTPFLNISLCVSVFCLCVCMYVHHLQAWHLNQIWELELQRVVNHHVDAGNWALSSENPASTLTVNHFCSPQGFCAWSARLSLNSISARFTFIIIIIIIINFHFNLEGHTYAMVLMWRSEGNLVEFCPSTLWGYVILIRERHKHQFATDRKLTKIEYC